MSFTEKMKQIDTFIVSLSCAFCGAHVSKDEVHLCKNHPNHPDNKTEPTNQSGDLHGSGEERRPATS